MKLLLALVLMILGGWVTLAVGGILGLPCIAAGVALHRTVDPMAEEGLVMWLCLASLVYGAIQIGSCILHW